MIRIQKPHEYKYLVNMGKDSYFYAYEIFYLYSIKTLPRYFWNPRKSYEDGKNNGYKQWILEFLQW